jgi:hypothetical protein
MRPADPRRDAAGACRAHHGRHRPGRRADPSRSSWNTTCSWTSCGTSRVPHFSPWTPPGFSAIVREVTESRRAMDLNRTLAGRLITSQEDERQRIAARAPRPHGAASLAARRRSGDAGPRRRFADRPAWAGSPPLSSHAPPSWAAISSALAPAASGYA